MLTMPRKRHVTTWTPERIQQLRAALTEHFGWTQVEIAEQVGVSDRQWRNWEADERQPAKSASIALDLLNRKLPAEKRP